MNQVESTFWGLSKPHYPGDVSRIENSVDDGTPDVSGATNGVDYWVELKICHNKTKFRDVTKLLEDSQLIWHLRRGKEGSLIFVAVQYDIMKKIALYLYNYKMCRYILICVCNKKVGYNWELFERSVQNQIDLHKERR